MALHTPASGSAASRGLPPALIQAAVYRGPGQIALTQLDRPSCPPGAVLVEVEVSGICGSDLVVYSGGRPQPQNPPGHEFSGTIVEVGAGVQGWAVGDRICPESFSHCGDCEACLRGDTNICHRRVDMPAQGPAGLSQIAVVAASSLHRLPPAVDFELGALVEPLAVGLHTLDRIVEPPVRRLLVLGAGAIGLSVLLCARARGIDEVWVVAKHRQQVELARSFGATGVLDPAKFAREGMAPAVDAVICTTPSGEALSRALQSCRRRGTVVVTSAYTAETPVQLRPVVWTELYLAGSISYANRVPQADFDLIIQWLADGTLRPRSLITHRFPLSEVAAAYRVAADKSTGSVKVLVQIREQP